jgi:hypothetical protein
MPLFWGHGQPSVTLPTLRKPLLWDASSDILLVAVPAVLQSWGACACRYGSLVRLLTEQPPKLSDADLMRLQRGQCAACRSLLPQPVKQSAFLGSRAAVAVCTHALKWLNHPSEPVSSSGRYCRIQCDAQTSDRLCSSVCSTCLLVPPLPFLLGLLKA